MKREMLLQLLEKKYSSKREMISRIPLGVQFDALWQDVINLRRSKSIGLPLYNPYGERYWYVITDRMIAASEKIVEEMYENESDFDPYTEVATVSSLEEVFFTSYIEGSQITMQDAIAFLTGTLPPRDIEEQLIANNRMAAKCAARNLSRQIDIKYIKELVCILTDGMEYGSGDFRTTDETDYISANGENYLFSPPQLIPSLMSDLCAFLIDPKIHPLIKAGTAQAYIMIVRPFTEGNDRLGRMLSSIILLRAGYTFFRDISLSSLIARKSYAYYEALNNILREENGGDLTYFLEFFLELLSRAVDERRLRIHRQEEHTRLEESAIARTPLTAAEPQPFIKTDLNPSDALPSLELTDPDNEEENDSMQVEVQENEISLAHGENAVDKSIGSARVKDELYRCLESDGKLVRKFSKLLLKFIEQDVETFTVHEIQQNCSVTPTQAANLVTHFREKGLIESCGARTKKHMLYRVGASLPGLSPSDYDDRIIKMIKNMIHSDASSKDKRIGDKLLACLPKGIITAEDYTEDYKEKKITMDMYIFEQIGLVKKLNPGIYRINRQIEIEHPILNEKQNKILETLFKAFNNKPFTLKMAMSALRYSKSYSASILRQLRQLNFLETKNAEHGRIFYTLLIKPSDQLSLFEKTSTMSEDIIIEYSEAFYKQLDILAASSSSQRDRRLSDSLRRCIDKGRLTPDDYKKWGYTQSMWLGDTDLAIQLGLIRKTENGEFLLNHTPCASRLKPSQKKTVAAIYEAFGNKEFSQEMLIATLNYSESHTYASLHKLTLLRVLERQNSGNGNKYQLLINPEDHPECFDTAA